MFELARAHAMPGNLPVQQHVDSAHKRLTIVLCAESRDLI